MLEKARVVIICLYNGSKGAGMEDKFLHLAENRRSIYGLGKRKILAEDEVVRLVEDMVKNCPTPFNSQSGRVVVLFEEMHYKLWNIVKEILRAQVPAEAFAKTEEKINSFAAGYGTILYFIDESVTIELQSSFPLYADKFPVWAEQANGILQYMIWTALAENKVGASLQHYNPLIYNKVHEEWQVPSEWCLRAQMPFGSIEMPSAEKTYLPVEERVKVFK